MIADAGTDTLAPAVSPRPSRRIAAVDAHFALLDQRAEPLEAITRALCVNGGATLDA